MGTCKGSFGVVAGRNRTVTHVVALEGCVNRTRTDCMDADVLRGKPGLRTMTMPWTAALLVP